MKHQGKIRNITGVFLAGKNTMVDQLMARRSDVHRSISLTTRPPREYEINGQHYHFCTDEAFEAAVQEGLLLEHAGIWGQHRYGTPLSELQTAQTAGQVLLTQCDVQGLEQLLEGCEDVCSVFLDISRDEQIRRYGNRPGSAETLEERLDGSQRERDHFHRLQQKFSGCLWVVENEKTVEVGYRLVEDFLFN